LLLDLRTVVSDLTKRSSRNLLFFSKHMVSVILLKLPAHWTHTLRSC